MATPVPCTQDIDIEIAGKEILKGAHLKLAVDCRYGMMERIPFGLRVFDLP